MYNCSLTLIPYGKSPVKIELSEHEPLQDALEQAMEHSSKNEIFSDLSYEFQLHCADLDSIQNVQVYVNDVYEESSYSKGKIQFLEKNSSDRRIFCDCFGFVALNLTLTMNDGTERVFWSDYLPVLVLRDSSNKSSTLKENVRAMANFVYERQELLWGNGEPKPWDLVGLKKSKYRNLMAQMILARDIATIYESSYGFFKANSRFHVEKRPTVDRFERLQCISPATLQYIASHPEQLTMAAGNSGIRVNRRMYQPQKALFMRNERSYDIYENRVVVNFLQKMIDEIASLQKKCQDLLNKIPDGVDYSDEYVYSTFFMYAETKKVLENGLHQLAKLKERYNKLWNMYHSILAVPSEPISKGPKATSIFISVPQYNRIFVRMHQWFSFGLYDFKKEQFMLSFIKISSLYESYLLVKMIDCLKKKGYVLHEPGRQIKYQINPKRKYKNTVCNNTFIFDGEKERITLYYQPVVFDTDKSSASGIGLYRNNSISVNDGDIGGEYYVPDFILKIEDQLTTKYLILDAKFSDIERVKKYHVKNLAFKYLFSISTVKRSDILAGMCIIYGKCNADDQLQNVYDKELSPIAPFAKMLPLIEGVAPDEQYNKLNEILDQAGCRLQGSV